MSILTLALAMIFELAKELASGKVTQAGLELIISFLLFLVFLLLCIIAKIRNDKERMEMLEGENEEHARRVQELEFFVHILEDDKIELRREIAKLKRELEDLRAFRARRTDYESTTIFENQYLKRKIQELSMRRPELNCLPYPWGPMHYQQRWSRPQPHYRPISKKSSFTNVKSTGPVLGVSRQDTGLTGNDPTTIQPQVQSSMAVAPQATIPSIIVTAPVTNETNDEEENEKMDWEPFLPMAPSSAASSAASSPAASAPAAPAPAASAPAASSPAVVSPTASFLVAPSPPGEILTQQRATDAPPTSAGSSTSRQEMVSNRTSSGATQSSTTSASEASSSRNKRRAVSSHGRGSGNLDSAIKSQYSSSENLFSNAQPDRVTPLPSTSDDAEAKAFANPDLSVLIKPGKDNSAPGKGSKVTLAFTNPLCGMQTATQASNRILEWIKGHQVVLDRWVKTQSIQEWESKAMVRDCGWTLEWLKLKNPPASEKKDNGKFAPLFKFGTNLGKFLNKQHQGRTPEVEALVSWTDELITQRYRK